MRRFLLFFILAFISLDVCGQQSLTLEQCRELALENSFEAKEARLNIKAAKYQREEAFAEYFPRVQMIGLGFQSRYPIIKKGFSDFLSGAELDAAYLWAFETGMPTSIEMPRYGYGSFVSVIQPLFTGLRIVRGNQLAKLGVKAAELMQGVQQRKTKEELDEYYWQTVDLQEKLATLSRFQNMVESIYKDAQGALASGLITQEELLQVQLKRNELITTRTKLNSGIRLCKLRLLNYIGLKYDYSTLDSLVIVSDVTDSPSSPAKYYVDEERVAANLEESTLIDLNVQALKLQKQMELGANLPQLFVGANYGYTRLGNQDIKNNAFAVATLYIPITDWWKGSLKRARMQTEIDKAIAKKEYVSEQLILLVRKTWIELSVAWDEYNIAQETEFTAAHHFEGQKAKYSAGLVTMSELLQSEAQLRQAANAVCDARIAYSKALRSWLDFIK